MTPASPLGKLSQDELASLWRATPASLAATLSQNDNEPWRAAPHLRILSKWMVEAATGKRPRIIVNLPPRHGKSFFISRWVPVWYLENWPFKNIINCGYATEFAERWGREVRNLVSQHSAKLSFQLAPDSKARGRWNTTAGGGMIATGVGGQITGRGADCLPAGTMITTERGQVDIAALVAMTPEARPRVLSANHTTGQLVWSRIIATKVSSATELIEVTTTAGHRLRATGRHLFYTASGYGKASESTIATEMYALSDVVLAESLRVRQVDTTRAYRCLLFSQLQPATPRVQEHTQVPARALSKPSEERPNVLQPDLSEGSAITHALAHSLPGVRSELLSVFQPHNVLQPSVCEQGSRGQDAGNRELSLHARPQLRQAFQSHASGDIGTGPRPVRGVQVNHGNIGVSASEQELRKDQSCSSPHRRESAEQRPEQPDNALRGLSHGSPQIHPDPVSMVRQIRGEQVQVYDIQVEGTSNFFANGLLVHNCLIVDDPVKDHQDANSSTQRERVWDWWKNTARTRLEPNGAIVILMTRWHEDDLVGRLTKEMAQGTGEHWDILNLPAISGRVAEDSKGVPLFPEFWEQDPEQGPCILGRKPGQALWPARYPKEALDQLRRGTSEEAWAAQYQGSPANLVGAGNVYKSFNAAGNVAPTVFNPRRPLVWSMDFNVNPMCSVLAQWDDELTPITYLTGEFRRRIQVMQELCLPDSSTMEMCEAFLLRTAPYLKQMQGQPLKVIIYGDRSGNSRKTVGDTDYATIKQFFRAHREYNISTRLSTANPAVKDRVNAVNMMLCSAIGERNTVIDPTCKELIKDFREVKWKQDAGGNTSGNIDKSDGSRTHASDAYGYFAEKEFKVRFTDIGQTGAILR